jgi:putative transposase
MHNVSSLRQYRFWEHQIRDEVDFKWHVDYIHYNPVKHGLVESPLDWAYSSFRKYVAQGKYSAHWGAGEPLVFADEVGQE